MRSATADSRNAERTTHIDTTTRCRTQRRNPLCPERPQPHPPHTTRYLSSPAAATLPRKSKVSCSGFLPNKPHATCMQPWQYVLQHHVANLHLSTLYTHGNTRSQQSCGHSNAIRNHKFKKRKELRTQDQPLVAGHRSEAITSGTTAAAPAGHTRYLSSQAAATLHAKCTVSCSDFLPNTSPMQHSCSHYNAFCSIT